MLLPSNIIVFASTQRKNRLFTAFLQKSKNHASRIWHLRAVLAGSTPFLDYYSTPTLFGGDFDSPFPVVLKSHFMLWKNRTFGFSAFNQKQRYKKKSPIRSLRRRREPDRRTANKPRDSGYRLQFRQYHRLFTQPIIKKHTIIYRQVSHAISAKDLPFI